MSQVFRSDLSEPKNPVITPAGYLQADAYLTRAGVFAYTDSTGRVTRELRHPDDVFDPKSLETLRLVPVTDLHPPVPVSADNAKFFACGGVGDGVGRDGDFVRAMVGVTDSALLSRVQQGQRELSCGYYCDIANEQGTYNGEAYDVRQKNIRYDHVAIVPKGRAGDEVRLRIDGAHSRVDHKETPPTPAPNHKEDSMKKIVIDGKECEVSEVAALLIEGALAKRDAAAKQAQDEAVAAKKDADTQRGRADAAEGELTKEKKARADATSPAKVQELVQARVALEKSAAAILPGQKFDAMDDGAIKKAVIAKIQPELKLDTVTADFVDGAFGLIVKSAEGENPALDALRAAGSPPPGTPPSPEQQTTDARDAMIKRNAEAHERYRKQHAS